MKKCWIAFRCFLTVAVASCLQISLLKSWSRNQNAHELISANTWKSFWKGENVSASISLACAVSKAYTLCTSLKRTLIQLSFLLKHNTLRSPFSSVLLKRYLSCHFEFCLLLNIFSLFPKFAFHLLFQTLWCLVFPCPGFLHLSHPVVCISNLLLPVFSCRIVLISCLPFALFVTLHLGLCFAFMFALEIQKCQCLHFLMNHKLYLCGKCPHQSYSTNPGHNSDFQVKDNLCSLWPCL